MGFTQVTGQGALHSASGAVTTISVTLTNNPTSGNVVCVAVLVAQQAGSIPVTGLTIQDSNSNSYTVTTHSPATKTGGDSVWLGYLLSAPANASKTITATWTGTTGLNGNGIWADEFSVSGGTAAFDKDAAQTTGTGSRNTLNLPSITPTGTNELFYAAAISSTSNISAPAAGATLGSWTGAGGGLDAQTGGAAEFALSVSAPLAVQFTDPTSSDTFAAMSMAFTFTAAAGGITASLSDNWDLPISTF